MKIKKFKALERYLYRLIAIIIFLACVVVSLDAQQRPSSVNSSYGRESGSSTRSSRDTSGGFIQQRDKFFNEIVNVDTLDAYYHNLLRPTDIFAVSDTAIHNYSHHYDYSRIRANDFAHLGNVGSASFPLIYQQNRYEGTDIGLHAMDIWKFGDADRRFYTLTKSFSHFGYSQANQANQVFNATFARAFEDNINIALDYRRINQVGIYQQNNIDHSNLHLGLNYNSPNKRYKVYLSMISNGLEGDESGGIATDTLFGVEDFETANRIPIKLEEGSDDGAKFRHQERSFQLYQSYKLVKDSSDLSKPQITLSNAFTYESNDYKFGDVLNQTSDILNAADQAFYPAAFQINPQGLRMHIDEQVYSNHFKVFLGNTASNTDSTTHKKNIEAGIKLKSHQIDDEVSSQFIFDVILTGGGVLELGSSVSVATSNHFVVAGDNAGAYEIEGIFLIDLGKLGALNAFVHNQNHRPSLIQQRAPISGTSIWQNDFSNINEISIGAQYGLQSLKAEVGVTYHLLNNYIYFDQTFTPIQKGSEVSILQVSLTKNFNLGHFHLDNYGVYQNSSSNDVPLPTYFSKHSLYYEGQVFKKRMLLRTGFETRLVGDYAGYSYMPLLGQFSPNQADPLEALSQADFFMSFKVGHMRVFAKVEHLEDFFQTKKEYLVKDYPIYDKVFRFGLSWYLMN